MDIILEGLLGVFSLIIILLLAAFSYRAWRQHQNARLFAIKTPNGIDEGRFVTIKGVDEWVSIRGTDRNNPVLLILHGGPALSYRSLIGTFRLWEKYFTIVHWERPGTGKTFGRNGKVGSGVMTFNRMADDGIELTEFLCQHLNKQKIILLGHSAGSIIGVLMVKRRPELFSAYVGTGQVTDTVSNENLSYDLALERAKKTNNKKVLTLLEKVGPLPYKDSKTWGAKLQCLMDNSPFEGRWLQKTFFPTLIVAPNYSLKDIYNFISAMFFSAKSLFEDQMAYDARRLGVNFEVPIFIFQGEFDVITPNSLVEAYFNTIEAPRKEFVIIEGGGHFSMLIKSDLFLSQLIECLRPLSSEVIRLAR